MKARFAFTVLIMFAITWTSTAQSSFGQRDGGPPAGIGRGRMSSEEQEEYIARALVDVDFPGGTIGDFLEALKAANVDMQFMADDDVKQINMPAFNFKRLSRRSFPIEKILSLGDQRVQVEIIQKTNGQLGPTGPGNIVRLHSLSKLASEQPAPPQILDVIDLSTVINLNASDEELAKSIDDVISTIGVGLELIDQDRKMPAPVLKVHERTSLLFFYGTTQQSKVVTQVLKQLARTGSLKIQQQNQSGSFN